AAAGEPTLEVSNPGVDAFVVPGSLVMDGIAYDQRAPSGVGIELVSVFLDDRETGGRFLGSAVLGKPNPLDSTSRFANAGWTIETAPIQGRGERHELFIYARSSVPGPEAVARIPVTVGHEPPSSGSVSKTIVSPQPLPGPQALVSSTQ